MVTEETRAHETQMTEMQATLKKSMMAIKNQGVQVSSQIIKETNSQC